MKRIDRGGVPSSSFCLGFLLRLVDKHLRVEKIKTKNTSGGMR